MSRYLLPLSVLGTVAGAAVLLNNSSHSIQDLISENEGKKQQKTVPRSLVFKE
ncbi:hypothetical protein H8959_006575 [Pygathrix nigripes]